MANADSGRANSRRMADVGADGVSRDGKLHTPHTPRAVRNARVEALRLAAIVGISLFHTMMPWTAQALCDPAAGCSRIGDMLGSDPAVLAVLGVIALMGAWGNHVFFMISGFYLIPSLARRSTQAGVLARRVAGHRTPCAGDRRVGGVGGGGRARIRRVGHAVGERASGVAVDVGD